jgi:hypothetical protein
MGAQVTGGENTMRNILVPLLSALALSLPAAAKSASKDAGAQVTCKDGSRSKSGRGACSHHGGVASAQAQQQPQKSAKNNAKVDNGDTATTGPAKSGDSGGILGTLFGKRGGSAQGRGSTATPRSSTREGKSGTPTARCKDGTSSYSAHHSGTCSGHGGVAEWLER